MGRIEKLKRQAIKEATSRLLENDPPGTRGTGLTWDDVEQEGDGDQSDEIQKELHRAITTWFGGRMAHWVNNERYTGTSQVIMKDEALISKKIKEIIGRVFDGTNLLGGSRNSPDRGDRY